MEWLSSHWTELVIGALIVIIVRGDAILRLIKKGREDEKTEREAEIERRMAPMKERAESAERLNTTLRMEGEQSIKALRTCVDARDALESKNREQAEQITKLVGLQPEVFRITGELEELNQRLNALEERKRIGSGGRHRNEDTTR